VIVTVGVCGGGVTPGVRDASIGNVLERATLGGRWKLLPRRQGRRGRGDGAIPDGGFRAVNGRSSGAGHDSDDKYCTTVVSQYLPSQKRKMRAEGYMIFS